jgi:serine/threonine-protein kinase
VLFELISGSQPFEGGSLMELGAKIANEPALPLRSLRPDAPSGLETIIAKCLEKDRARRYRDVGELARALQRFAPVRSRTMVDRISGIVESGGPRSQPPAEAVTADAPPLRRSTATLKPVGLSAFGSPAGKATALGAGVLAILVIGGGATYLVLSGPLPARNTTEREAAVSPAPTTALLTPREIDAARIESVVLAPPPALALPKLVEATPDHDPAAADKVTQAPPPAAKSAAPMARARVPPPATPAAPPNCDPPYFFDARGNRNFKPECL